MSEQTTAGQPIKVEGKPALDILLADYNQRRNETIAFYGRYEKQTQVLTIYLSVLAIIYVVLSGLKNPDGNIIMPGMGPITIPRRLIESPNLGPFVILTFGALIAFYFIANLMESVHVMQLLQARSAAVEKALNALLGGDYLTWDSKLVPEFYERQQWEGLYCIETHLHNSRKVRSWEASPRTRLRVALFPCQRRRGSFRLSGYSPSWS